LLWYFLLWQTQLLQEDCWGTASFKLETNISYYSCIIRLVNYSTAENLPNKMSQKCNSFATIFFLKIGLTEVFTIEQI
jgi:hypothetical protein